MKKLKDYYNRKYYKTNEVVTPQKLKALELLEDTKKIGKVYNVLDLGCGTGILTQRIALKGHKVSEIDISKTAIVKLRKREIPRKVVDVSTDGIPFSNNYFDVVFALDIFEIVRDLNFVIEEIYRVLRPKGRLIFTVPYASFFYGDLNTCLGILLMIFIHLHIVIFFRFILLKEFLLMINGSLES